jgi:hypothetical protein
VSPFNKGGKEEIGKTNSNNKKQLAIEMNQSIREVFYE